MEKIAAYLIGLIIAYSGSAIAGISTPSSRTPNVDSIELDAPVTNNDWKFYADGVNLYLYQKYSNTYQGQNPQLTVDRNGKLKTYGAIESGGEVTTRGPLSITNGVTAIGSLGYFGNDFIINNNVFGDGIKLHSNGDLTIPMGVTSNKSCDTGYTRVTVNYCLRITQSLVTLTFNSCTTITAPQSAKIVDVTLVAIARANAAVAARSARVENHSSNTCGFPFSSQRAMAAAYEFTSITAGTELGRDHNTVAAYVTSGNIYLKLYGTSSNESSGQYIVNGYWD